MALNMNDDIGKRIVEALKEQTTVDTDNDMIIEESNTSNLDSETLETDLFNDSDSSTAQTASYTSNIISNQQNLLDDAFNKSLADNLMPSSSDVISYPNVEILKQLITKLPTGVPKATGALIIQQTMEALGIPVSGVIQEAILAKESLLSKAAECQNNILESKKQINKAESQILQCQRQATLLNDIIKLFNHATK